MNSIAQQIANDKNLTINDVDDILKGFSKLLANRIPELKQVIEDVIADEDSGKLKEHINRMVILLEDKNAEVFKTWTMPEQNYIFRRCGNGPLF
jgi:hypothetical protein